MDLADPVDQLAPVRQERVRRRLVRDHVVHTLREGDGELESDLAAGAVAEDGSRRVAHGSHDGDDVARLLDGVQGFRAGGDFAAGLLPAVVGDDGEVCVEVGDDGEEGLGLAAGAGDHDQHWAAAAVVVDEGAAFGLDGAPGQGGGDGGWVEGRGDVFGHCVRCLGCLTDEL